MIMAPRVRRFVLTAHITSTIGWLGAVAAFLALGIVGLTSQDAQMVRAGHLAAEPITYFVLVPLSLTSLLTGIMQALGTTWGLFRHYWVLFKLLLTVVATVVLLSYTRTVRLFADMASDPGTDLIELRSPTFVLHSGGGLVVLLVAAILSVYKPRGMTRYGQRKRHELRARQREPVRVSPTP